MACQAHAQKCAKKITYKESLQNRRNPRIALLNLKNSIFFSPIIFNFASLRSLIILKNRKKRVIRSNLAPLYIVSIVYALLFPTSSSDVEEENAKLYGKELNKSSQNQNLRY